LKISVPRPTTILNIPSSSFSACKLFIKTASTYGTTIHMPRLFVYFAELLGKASQISKM